MVCKRKWHFQIALKGLEGEDSEFKHAAEYHHKPFAVKRSFHKESIIFYTEKNKLGGSFCLMMNNAWQSTRPS